MSRIPVKAYLGGKQLYKTSSRSSDHYVRPSDWLVLPNAPEPEGVSALVAVFDDDANFITVRCQGAYTVDWGDGTAPVNHASLTTAVYNYNWNNISSSTLCSRGYRQAIVTITPQAGNTLTILNLTVKHTQAGLVNGYSSPWLDMNLNLPNVTTLTLSSATAAKSALLERVYIKTWGSLASLNSSFRGAHSLQSLNEHEWDTSNITTFGATFAECYSLKYLDATNWNTSSVTTFNSAFSNCSNLKNIKGVENLNVSSVTNFSGMFQYCYSLFEETPNLDLTAWNTISAINLTSIFRENYNLISVNLSSWVIPNATSMAAMFNSSYNIQSIDLSNISMPSVISLIDFIPNCYSLKILKLPNISSVTNFGTVFASNCNNLSKITFEASGINASINFTNCNFSASDLNYIYTNLSSTGSGKTITVTGNYGVNGDDPTIATNKGWTVTG